MPRDLHLIGGHRHPDNRMPQGGPEFYAEEARLYGFPTPQSYAIYKKAHTPKCPVCGTPIGFSFGTGNCGCEEYP